jgi:ion channel-forming bestrophin family protein
MILKHNLSPARVLGYVWQPVLYAITVAIAAVALFEITDWQSLAIPFAPVGVLGSAMAIFVAFRNNASFARWWDARTAWQAIHNASRNFARHLVSFTADAVSSGRATPEQAHDYATELLHRQIAFAHVLRSQLRGTQGWADDLIGLVEADEIESLHAAINPANRLLITQGIRLKDGIRDGLLGQFDPISIEPNFGQFTVQQGLLERIKHTPTPRQYEYFTRMFVLLFATALPFALLSVFTTQWIVVPVSTMLAGVFVIMATVGTANENPMENRTTDVPLTAICTDIERDLRDALGELEIPTALAPANGYLW